MILNGKYVEIKEKQTVSELLKNKGYRADTVAVELNGDILSKKSYDDVIVTEADTMEVVAFMGGG